MGTMRATIALGMIAAGCAGFTNVASDPDDDADAGVCAVVECDRRALSCGNCMDDDADGLVDAADPDCLGACDNNEAGLYLDLPGSPTSSCSRDCYFDVNHGNGNDGCAWDLECDAAGPGGALCPFEDPPSASSECPPAQDPMCSVECMPLVPNGCDCFGCCELVADSGQFVFVGSVADDGRTPTCTAALAGDPVACRPCTPVEECLNRCERCELCLGKRPEDLPADCTEPADCTGGRAPCGRPGLGPCAEGQYCITGCCTYFG